MVFFSSSFFSYHDKYFIFFFFFWGDWSRASRPERWNEKVEIESYKLFVRGNAKSVVPCRLFLWHDFVRPGQSCRVSSSIRGTYTVRKDISDCPLDRSWLKGHVCALWCDVRAYMHGTGEEHGWHALCIRVTRAGKRSPHSREMGEILKGGKFARRKVRHVHFTRLYTSGLFFLKWKTYRHDYDVKVSYISLKVFHKSRQKYKIAKLILARVRARGWNKEFSIIIQQWTVRVILCFRNYFLVIVEFHR